MSFLPLPYVIPAAPLRHSRAGGNPDDLRLLLDSRLRGNDDGADNLDSRLRGNDDDADNLDSRKNDVDHRGWRGNTGKGRSRYSATPISPML